jgi:2-dehydro-3-deoxy-D-arabinonate dehydratase
MLLYNTAAGPVVHAQGGWHPVDRPWDDLVNDDGLAAFLSRHVAATAPIEPPAADAVRAPIGGQEVWAAGVTYLRSRTARVEEAQAAGGGDFYDRVYDAARPEVFFKATPHRIVGPGGAMHLRRDSRWIVPEPELVLVITRRGAVIGYSVGNDLSCRDIEGENPLYLPQAKTFDRCAGLGPAILVSETAPDPSATIALAIRRGDVTVVQDSTTLGQMKRTLEELVRYLFAENSHPNGVLLMTGTGIVPPDNFTLQAGDVVEITIDGIGTLLNIME